uniref:Uncharacterized protein n=1 Tax=Molossus molossus TaxID=27622 RepID=A0A7J8C8Z8_MOLMO|nr:hypothetical protein HJG59_009935 [Molossus molossus]
MRKLELDQYDQVIPQRTEKKKEKKRIKVICLMHPHLKHLFPVLWLFLKELHFGERIHKILEGLHLRSTSKMLRKVSIPNSRDVCFGKTQTTHKWWSRNKRLQKSHPKVFLQPMTQDVYVTLDIHNLDTHRIYKLY